MPLQQQLSGMRNRSAAYSILVKNGFPTRLNSREVKVEQKMTGKETVKVKLLSRAVVKAQGLGDVCLHKRRCTQIGT